MLLLLLLLVVVVMVAAAAAAEVWTNALCLCGRGGGSNTTVWNNQWRGFHSTYPPPPTYIRTKGSPSFVLLACFYSSTRFMTELVVVVRA